MATKDTGGQRQPSKRSEETEEAEPQASGDDDTNAQDEPAADPAEKESSD